MLKCQVIGIGAAGNKGSIQLVNDQVVPLANVILLNSTIKDVPNGYEANYIQLADSEYGEELGGAGKEPDIGEKLCLEAIQNGTLNLDELILPDTKVVIVIASTEGGTGCGAAPVIGKYISEVLGVNVHHFAFLGFEDDARGLLNTVRFFKSISEKTAVQCIRNKRFIGRQGCDYRKAEELANIEMSKRVSILLGNSIMPSAQNMDDKDLFKVSTRYGYMNIEHRDITDTIKNTAHFGEIIREMIDETKSLRPDGKSQKVMGVIINIPENEKSSIDYSFKDITDKYGVPFEKFVHIQTVDSMNPFIAFISSGMDLPLGEVKTIYDKYVSATSSVAKNKDDFFDSIQELKADDGDDVFNLKPNKKGTMKQSDFFSKFNMQTPNRPGETAKKPAKSTDDL